MQDPYALTPDQMMTPARAPAVPESPQVTTIPQSPRFPMNEKAPEERQYEERDRRDYRPPRNGHTTVAPDRALAAVVYPKMYDLELTVGVPSLEQLHAERAALVALNSRVKALKHNALWKDLRDIELSRAAARFRAEWTGEKAPSEALVTSSAQADPTYVAYIQQLDVMFASYEVVEDRITQINELINRGQALIRYVSSEPK